MMNSVDNCLEMVKQYWPHYAISKEDLTRPTAAFVYKFYTDVLKECHEKLDFLSNTSENDDNNSKDQLPEERLYVQIAELFNPIFSSTFTIADIMAPTPAKTRTFIMVFAHFLVFSEAQIPEVDLLTRGVFEKKKEINRLLIENEFKSQKIGDLKQEKEILTEQLNKLNIEENRILINYNNTKEINANKEKNFYQKKNEIERLKWEIQNEEYESANFDTIEKNLREQQVTEGEYKAMLATQKTLKDEIYRLDSFTVGVDDNLSSETNDLERYTNCLRNLKKLEFDVQSFKKLITREEMLTSLVDNVENYTSNQLAPLKKDESATTEVLNNLEQLIAMLQQEHQDVLNIYKNTLNNLSKMEKTKGEMVKIQLKNTDKIKTLNERIKIQVQKLIQLKIEFKPKYDKIIETEDWVKKEFGQLLSNIYQNLRSYN